MDDRTTLDLLQTQLQAALSHLYDPMFTPDDALCAVLNLSPDAGRGCIRRALLEAIASLQPAVETPHTTEAYRIYQVLTLRYAEHLTQVQTAERLSITSRHLRREQRHAVRVLAAALLERAEQEVAPEPTTPGPSQDWETQARQEVALLERQAPASTADLRTTFEGALSLARHVTQVRDVAVLMPALPGNLVIALHPTLLRQLLLAALTSLAAQTSPGGKLEVRVVPMASAVALHFRAQPLLAGAEAPGEAVAQMVPLAGASQIHVAWDQETHTLCLDLPLACELHVLVIDDNDDLVHVFRRYTDGTAFVIDPVKTEPDALEAIAAHPPAVIVLDIMLPETDGWELLVHLHEHPVARDIPIVVCSVVREWDLALALGAHAYLPKPVRARQFIEALVAAVSSSTTVSSQTPTPSSADSAA
jgi:CheY-like chemotaxis protein